MLGILPTELILTVLSFLPLRQLQRLQQISKLWGNFIEVNESEIYHAAAILHNFIKPNTSLQDAQQKHVWLQRVHSWKDLCHSYCRLERRWEGYEQPDAAIVAATGKAVWRFKVDEEQSTVITTHFDGGLGVAAIGGDGILWLLPHSEVHAYAHCEYTDGYLVLTRRGQGVDVWRRKRDMKDIELPSTLRSDWRQQRARRSAWQSPLSVEQDDRGAFVPWTTIQPPHPIHALRAVNATLLLASYSAQEAYLYDISSGKHIQTLPFDKDPATPPIDLSYVELSRRHIFVCGDRDVIVVPLDPSDSQTFLKFPSQVPGFDELYKQRAQRVLFDEEGPVYKSLEDPDGTLLECMCELESEYSTPLDPSGLRNFKAVHVSPCGSHFATVDEKGCICIVRNFEQALHNGSSLLNCITIVDMQHPIGNLAFEDNRRIAVYVDHQGVFIIPLASQDDISIDTLDMKPLGRLRVLHVRDHHDDSLYESVNVQFCSCLQMTPSEIWYSWTRMHAQQELGVANNILRRIDFSAPQ